ncbi:phosphoribosyltransferase family protein [Marinilabiliaceae bacterium ANBcel2]|nr:phosphoribosyltransferase family protein [Marinilabiliaceae bacterium ANBcel2]
MKVLNLLNSEFDKGCEELANMVTDSFMPDIVFGILTGGGVAGRKIYEEIKKKKDDLLYEEVLIQRSSTRIKKGLAVKSYLGRLPQPLLNILRNIEVELLELKAKIVKPKRHGLKPLKESTVNLLNKKELKILIIDDCIDTGATIQLLKSHIGNVSKLNHDIKVAVFTVAHRKPIEEPDYTIYRRVLLRFPWACDVNEK